MSIFSLLLSSALAGEVTSVPEYPYFNAQAFRPSVDSKNFFWVTDSSLTTDKYLFRAVYSFTDSPFTYTDYQGNSYTIIDHINQFDMIGGLRFGDFRIGAVVPLFLGTSGYLNQQLSRVVAGEIASDPISESSGIGDITLDAKYRIFEGNEKPIGLVASVRGTLPTNNSSLPLGSTGSLMEFEIGADKNISNFRLAANIGHRQTQDAGFQDMNEQMWTSGAYSRWGVSYSNDGNTGASVEYVNAMVYDTNTAGSNEALVSIWTPVEKVFLRTGFGIGMGEGVTTPKYRLLFSLEPSGAAPKDSDGDGIVDSKDQCPSIPEDADGVKDDDGCIDLTAVMVSIVDGKGKTIEGATWTLDDKTGANNTSFNWQVLDSNTVNISAKADGFAEKTMKAEIVNGDSSKITIKLEAGTGVIIVKATDQDGNPVDAMWGLKGLRQTKMYPANEMHNVRPGKKTIQIRAKGFKPITHAIEIHSGKEEVIEVKMVSSKANVSGDKIEISDSVYFASGKDVILEKSHQLLVDVADILKEHPNIKKVEIEGHTDSDGKAASNKALSQARAEAVRTFLIENGIADERLIAIGYGEEKPIADNNTPEGKALNRRVHFHIAEFEAPKEAEFKVHEEDLPKEETKDTEKKSSEEKKQEEIKQK